MTPTARARDATDMAIISVLCWPGGPSSPSSASRTSSIHRCLVTARGWGIRRAQLLEDVVALGRPALASASHARGDNRAPRRPLPDNLGKGQSLEVPLTRFDVEGHRTAICSTPANARASVWLARRKQATTPPYWRGCARTAGDQTPSRHEENGGRCSSARRATFDRVR